MQYAIWNDELKTPTSILQRLPDNLENAPQEEVRRLGYREVVTVRPDDYIPRFMSLSGESRFELRNDGRIYQTFPKANFSLKNVRAHLKEMAAKDASRVLFNTDWYVIRKAELGTEIPQDIVDLRQRIRGHLDWIEQDVDRTGARELVEQVGLPNEYNPDFADGTWVEITGEAVPEEGHMTKDPEKGLPPLMPPGNPVAMPDRFNSNMVPLRVRSDGMLRSEQDLASLDAADIPPIIPDDKRLYYDPGPEDEASHVAQFDPLQARVDDKNDIRRMSEEERAALDPEVRRRLEEEDRARYDEEKARRLVILKEGK